MTDERPGRCSNRHAWFCWLLIVLLAGTLRFWGLDNNPPGLFRDEAEKGYNAWALATHGGALDLGPPEHAGEQPFQFRRWPWMIKVSGAYTSAIYQYADAPFVGLGGLTVANTRRAAALAGTLAVALLGAAGIYIWGWRMGLLAALWLALSPWHIIFSRWAQQSSFVPLLLGCALLGCWGVEREKKWGWPLAGAALGWLFYAYSGAQPFVLTWGICLILIYRRALRLKNIWMWIGAVSFLIPVAPTLRYILLPAGGARLGQVALWSEPGTTATGVIIKTLTDYFSHFSPGFLFFRGDANVRHAVVGYGEMLWVDLLFLPVGIWWAWHARLPLRGTLLACLLCGPMPAAITQGAPHALRAFPMALPAVVFAAFGLGHLLESIRRQATAGKAPPRVMKMYISLLLLMCIALGMNTWLRSFRNAAHEAATGLAFQQKMREAWSEIGAQRKPEQKVYVSALFPYAPYFQLFYERVDPVRVASEGLAWTGVEYINTLDSRALEQVGHGDWLLTPLPPDNPVMLTESGLDAARARAIGEYWPYLTQR